MEKNIIDSTTSKKPASRSTAFKAKVTNPVKPKPYSTFNFQDHLDQYTIKVQQMKETRKNIEADRGRGLCAFSTDSTKVF